MLACRTSNQNVKWADTRDLLSSQSGRPFERRLGGPEPNFHIGKGLKKIVSPTTADFRTRSDLSNGWDTTNSTCVCLPAELIPSHKNILRRVRRDRERKREMVEEPRRVRVNSQRVWRCQDPKRWPLPLRVCWLVCVCVIVHSRMGWVVEFPFKLCPWHRNTFYLDNGFFSISLALVCPWHSRPYERRWLKESRES